MKNNIVRIEQIENAMTRSAAKDLYLALRARRSSAIRGGAHRACSHLMGPTMSSWNKYKNNTVRHENEYQSEDEKVDHFKELAKKENVPRTFLVGEHVVSDVDGEWDIYEAHYFHE